MKCPNFAALSCCVFTSKYFHVRESRVLDCAHCTSCGLILLCAYFVEVVRDALHRCMDRACCVHHTHRMFLAVHTKVTFDTFSVCLMWLVFTCLFHFVRCFVFTDCPVLYSVLLLY